MKQIIRLSDLKEEKREGRKPPGSSFTDKGRFQMRLPDEIQPELEKVAKKIGESKAVLLRRTVIELLKGNAVQWD